MASKLSPATPRPKAQRGLAADGEGISPAGKKGTAMRFGDNNSPKATRSPRSFGTEKKTPVSRGAELQQVHEELAKTKEQLALVEKSKSNLVQDLARTKRQMEELHSKLQDVNEFSKKDGSSVKEMEHTAAEDWQAEIETMRKQYDAAVLDLQENKQTMENLKHELFICIEARDEAVRLAGEAMNAAETTAKRVEEMSAELLAAKGFTGMGGSMLETVQDLIVDSSSTEVVHADSTAVTPDLLVAKEAELRSSQEYVSQLQVEVENLKADLTLLQKLVTEQRTSEENTQEAADLLAAKEAELQFALQEAIHHRSHLENVKQELSAVQQLVEQHERSAKEAADLICQMDNECQNALHEASELRSKVGCMEEELSMSQKWALQHADGVNALGLCQSELATALETEKSVRAQLLEMTLKVDRLNDELTLSKATERKSCMQLADATNELEQLKMELASTSDAKEEACIAENVAFSNLCKMKAEVSKAKEAESTALASISTLSNDLKETQIKLVKANLEASMLANFLESLKADLEQKQLDLTMAQEKQLKEREMVETLNLELTKTKDANHKASELMSAQLASAQAAMEVLQANSERQRLGLIEMTDKEALASEKIIGLTRKLENTEVELVELKRQQEVASEKSLNLAVQLDLNLNQISDLKSKERNLNASVSSLMKVLEDKEHEITDWKRKIDIAGSTYSALLYEMENTKAELVELKGRETSTSMKASALSVVLASLTEKNEIRVNDLKEREAVVNARVETLNGELVKAKVDLEEALTAGEVAKDEADKLQVSLQLATLELDHARQDRQKLMSEAAWSKKDAAVTLVKLQEAKSEAEKANEARCLADSYKQKQSQEIKSLTLSLQLAHNDNIQARREIELLNNKLSTAMLEMHKNKSEMEKAGQEVEGLRKDAETSQTSILMYKEQALAMKDQLQAARDELKQMKDEMYHELNEERVQSPNRTVNVGPQDAQKEPELLKLDATSVQTESLIQTHSTNAERCCDSAREELENLKFKMHQTEERLAVALKEIENSRSSNHSMLQNFETMRKEKEANERALLEVHQHLADTEKAKSNLEAEIQRLLDESKQWQTMKDAVDIPIQSEALICSFAPECRDEKPQPDSPSEASELVVSPLHDGFYVEERTVERQDKAMKEHIAWREDFACLSLRREDSSEKDDCIMRDDVSLCDEPTSVPTKKKKKTLLLRLGTLLEKKKSASQPTS